MDCELAKGTVSLATLTVVICLAYWKRNLKIIKLSFKHRLVVSKSTLSLRKEFGCRITITS